MFSVSVCHLYTLASINQRPPALPHHGYNWSLFCLCVSFLSPVTLTQVLCFLSFIYVFVFIVCVCLLCVCLLCVCILATALVCGSDDSLWELGFCFCYSGSRHWVQVVRPLVPSVFTSEPTYQAPAFSLLLVDSQSSVQSPLFRVGLAHVFVILFPNLHFVGPFSAVGLCCCSQCLLCFVPGMCCCCPAYILSVCQGFPAPNCRAWMVLLSLTFVKGTVGYLCNEE